MSNYIGYYRVSTEKQGQSGLGLSAQKDAIERFVQSINGNLIAEFTDVESGSKTDREGLKKVIAKASETNAVVVVKSIDRLSRDGFKVHTTMEELGITVIDCDSPTDEGLIRNIKLALAKDERDKIRTRTTSALSQIKLNIENHGYHISKSGNRIESLGTVENLGGALAIARSKKTRALKAKLDPNNIRAKATIDLLKDQGQSYRQIAKFLNDNGFNTSRGNLFSPSQVRNLHLRQ